jgi:DNA-directed RNA polymerase specialized sigma24 family protein
MTTNSAKPTIARSEWAEKVANGSLGRCSPEDLCLACLDLDRDQDGNLLGVLMQEIGDRSARFLRCRVGRHLPNQGEDIINATVAKVYDALLGASPADAAGFCEAFYPRLAMRLSDQIRSSRLKESREEEFPSDQSGEQPPIPDLAAATPEQQLMVAQLLNGVDERKRRAAVLQMAGYQIASDDPNEVTVCQMLNVSRRTAESWVREMKALIRERMKT